MADLFHSYADVVAVVILLLVIIGIFTISGTLHRIRAILENQETFRLRSIEANLVQIGETLYEIRSAQLHPVKGPPTSERSWLEDIDDKLRSGLRELEHTQKQISGLHEKLDDIDYRFHVLVGTGVEAGIDKVATTVALANPSKSLGNIENMLNNIHVILKTLESARTRED